MTFEKEYYMPSPDVIRKASEDVRNQERYIKWHKKYYGYDYGTPKHLTNHKRKNENHGT